jgi:hypothetical protein|tara:strand:+ start:365 stop:574 length:210 start_codon:yes stop_codon:yes gene_type:complete
MYNCTLQHNGDLITFLINQDSEQATVTYRFGYDDFTEVKQCFLHEAQERWNIAKDMGFKLAFVPNQWDL